jgi:hypothetical protein
MLGGGFDHDGGALAIFLLTVSIVLRPYQERLEVKYRQSETE